MILKLIWIIKQDVKINLKLFLMKICPLKLVILIVIYQLILLKITNQIIISFYYNLICNYLMQWSLRIQFYFCLVLIFKLLHFVNEYFPLINWRPTKLYQKYLLRLSTMSYIDFFIYRIFPSSYIIDIPATNNLALFSVSIKSWDGTWSSCVHQSNQT